jgi:hypothetical protein
MVLALLETRIRPHFCIVSIVSTISIIMETTEDDDDLKLVRASASLLADLETSLPKLLWKSSKTGNSHGAVHSRIKQKDLTYILNLVRPSHERLRITCSWKA